MSETNQIRSVGIQEPFQSRRRSTGVVAPQPSFEEELLKLQFFSTEVEAESSNAPVLPLESSVKNDKTSDEVTDSEGEEPAEPTETDKGPEDYVYAVIVPPPTVANDVVVEDENADAVAAEGELGIVAEPIAEEVVDGAQKANSPKISSDEKVAISSEENAGTPSDQQVPEKQIGELTEGVKEPQQTKEPVAPASNVETSLQQKPIETETNTPEVVEAKSDRPTRDKTQKEFDTELSLKASEQDNPESPDVETKEKEERSRVETASFQSTDRDEPEAEPKESRRAERLERNRLESESTTNDNRSQTTDEANLDTQISSDTTIESTDTESLATEPTMTSSTETVDSPVVVSSPSPNLPANASTISTPAGIVANAALNSSPSNAQSSGAVSVTNTVGGTSSTAAARESTGSSRVNLTPYQESKLVQRVLRGIEQLGNGGGQVRIRLHPPELGTLQMTLKFEATQVSAQFEVENRVARDALLSNSQVLKDRLKEQGLEVQKFEVEVRSDVNDSLNSSTGDRQERGNSSNGRNFESRFAIANNNRINTEVRQEQEPSSTPWVRTKGSLDLSA